VLAVQIRAAIEARVALVAGVLSIDRRMGVNTLAQFRQVFGSAECIRKLCQSYIWRSMGGFQMKKHARY